MHKQQNSTLSAGQINENKVRMIAFLVLLSVGLYLLTHLSIIAILLAFDFGLRSFDLGKYSPFAQLSEVLVKTLKLGVKPIFYPPKRFAARIGFMFSLCILALHFWGINPMLVAGILVFFAALESFAGICAGCSVYNWLIPVWEKFYSAK